MRLFSRSYSFFFLLCGFLELCRLICLRLRLLNYFFLLRGGLSRHIHSLNIDSSTEHMKKRRKKLISLELVTCVFDILEAAKMEQPEKKTLTSYRQGTFVCIGILCKKKTPVNKPNSKLKYDFSIKENIYSRKIHGDRYEEKKSILNIDRTHPKK